MRIALYNPPVHHYAGVRYRMNPALGLPILASVLRNDGHEVGVWDLEALGVSPADIANKYREDTNWPDAIGITVTSHGKRGFADTVLALRSAGYDGYIMAGGPHMSLDPKFGLDSGADVVVMGEGESAILRVVREMTTGLVLGEPIPIEEVPAPSWDVHFPKPNQYWGNLPVVDRPETITQFSRGCPHACLFCLPADSIVETGDSWETIRDIKVGTLVRTLNGVAEVTAKQIILHDGELVSLKVSGCAEPLEATPDHMIPVIRWGAINQRSAATNVVMRTEWLEAAQWDWVPAGEVAKGDFAIVPYDSVVEDDAAFSDAFCKLAGYYISEGHISKSSSRKDYWTMCCTFGSTEMAMAEHFLSLCKEELDLTAQGSVFRNEQNNTIQAQISGRRPIKYINDMFGTGAKNKHIPSGMMRLPVEKQANLLRTMYWGDGHISKKSVDYTTVSPVLARQVKQLLLRRGYVPVVHRVAASKRSRTIQGREVNSSDAYIVRVFGEGANDLASLLGWAWPRAKAPNRRYNRAYNIPSRSIAIYPVTSVSRRKFSGAVYDLTTNGSFVANGVAVSNCGNPIFNKQRIRMRPPQNIKSELEGLKRYGIKSLFVYDDELFGGGNGEWLQEVCKEIAPLGFTWKAQGRCSQKRIDEATLQAAYDAGCRYVMWGVESFSNKVLKDMKKGTTEDDIWHTLRLARKVGINNWLFLMVGNYRETAEDLAYTESQLSRAVQEDLVQARQVTVCTPVPGTELWELGQKEGWLKENPESGPQMAQVYAPTPDLTQSQIKHWKRRIEQA